MNLYRTTNLEEVLSVDNIFLKKYVTAMKAFLGKVKGTSKWFHFARSWYRSGSKRTVVYE